MLIIQYAEFHYLKQVQIFLTHSFIMYKLEQIKGFTLIELSIVLVIVGLLIGGILAAQSIIQTSHVLKLVSKVQQVEIATQNFFTTYKAIPGDTNIFIPVGTPDFALSWGGAGVNVTCNGIYYNLETYQGFAHLSAAGMIQPSYVPYSPVQCGGTHNDTPANVSNAGLFAPYSDLDGRAVNYNNTTKYPFIYTKSTDNTLLGFSFRINGRYALPLEAKMGVYANSSSEPGLRNDSGIGYCRYLSNGVLPCKDFNSQDARFTYRTNIQ